MKLSFANREAAGFSLVTILSILIMSGCLWFLWFGKKPDAKSAKEARAKMSRELQATLHTAADGKKRLETEVKGRVWQAKVDDLGPNALSKLAAVAKVNNVKVQAFRPQRTTDVSGLTMVPFQVSIDGKFVDVLKFIQAVDQPDTKMALQGVQFSSTDGNSDKVNAMVTVCAYHLVGGTRG